MGTRTAELKGYADMANEYYERLAAELHAIADDIRALPDEVEPAYWCMVALQPNPVASDDEKRRVVDALSVALLGELGVDVSIGDGWQHASGGRRDDVDISVYCGVKP